MREGDWETVAQYLTEDVELSPRVGESVKGHAAVMDRLKEGYAQFGSLTMTFDPAVVDGNVGYARWKYEGTGTDGTFISVVGLDLYHFVGNRISLKDVWQKL